MPAIEPTPPSRIDVERNRRMLLDAAANALARNPDVSMSQVAQAAGLTRATLYRHFDSRAKLLEAMRAEALAQAAEVISEAHLDQGTALEALHRVIEAVASLSERFRPLLIEGTDLGPTFLHQRAEVFAPLRDVVRRGQEAGLIRVDLPPQWIVTVMASILAAAVRDSGVLPEGGPGVADLVFGTLARGIEVTH